MLDSAHPTANARTNPRPRRSSAYITIMNVSATTPKAVVPSTRARVVHLLFT
jgi:hypothetical protein